MKSLGLGLIFLTLTACSPRTLTLTRSRLLMGHVPVNLSLRIRPDQRQAALEAGDGAYRLAQEIEARISEFQPNSEISCLNQQAGKASCSLSPDTYSLLLKALEIAQATDHAFDIRFASPTPAGRKGEILLEPGNRARLVNPGTRIGIASIGKGWIVDQMLDYLKQRGFTQALIDAGGDLRATGGPWKVAIQVPQGAPGEVTALREIQDMALGSSGLYEQGPHILDPSTGKPAIGGGSVTVEGNSLSVSGALGTAFFVMGEAKSQTYLQRFPGFAMIWTDADGTTRRYVSKINGQDPIKP